MSFTKRKFPELILPIVLIALAINMPYAYAQSQPASPQQGTATNQPQQTSPSTPPAAQPSPSVNPAAQPSPSTNPSPQTSAQQSTATITSGTTIPAGTLITITPTQPIQNPQVGSTYTAQISQNVSGTNGSVLIPAGTPAELTIASAVSPTGAPEQALALKSVTVNGQTYNISTNQGQSTTQSTNTSQSNALSPSIGGLLGTLVRAIGAGQQAGATNQQSGNGAQGALGSGALGSILGSILTHGATVNVPSQSQLTFRLDQPLQLQ